VSKKKGGKRVDKREWKKVFRNSLRYHGGGLIEALPVFASRGLEMACGKPHLIGVPELQKGK